MKVCDFLCVDAACTLKSAVAVARNQVGADVHSELVEACTAAALGSSGVPARRSPSVRRNARASLGTCVRLRSLRPLAR